MNDLKLSICIPCRIENNNGMLSYCQRCIDSIQHNIGIEKHKGEFEIILVDDESDCDGLQTVKFDGGINHAIIRNEKRRGIGGSRNAALEIAKGEYVHYMDADDYVANDYLEHLLKHLHESTDAEMFITSFMTQYADDKGKKTSRANDMAALHDFTLAPVSSCCKVVRRDKCVSFKESVYLEDVDQHFRQLDSVSGAEKVKVLADVAYWCYDNTRKTAYTRTANFLAANHFTMEQLSVQNILVKQGLKDRAISDLLRACAELYDMRNTLKHENVKRACLLRLNAIWNKILTNNFTH